MNKCHQTEHTGQVHSGDQPRQHVTVNLNLLSVHFIMEVHVIVLFCFASIWPHHTACEILVLTSQDQIHSPCIGSSESTPPDHQGSSTHTICSAEMKVKEKTIL